MTALETMRAVVLTGHGGPERLQLEGAWPRPRPAQSEVVVEVAACAVNATDINTRVGWYSKGNDNGAWDAPIAFPRIQGADVCGTVVEIGPGGEAGLIGQRVIVDPWVRDPEGPADPGRCGYLGSERDGGYAECVAVPAVNAHPIESALGDADLASFPTSAGTALNMVTRSGIRPGQTALVTGASGGVGTALLQLIRRVGAIPLAVCDPAKATAVTALGAETVIDREADLAGSLRDATGTAQVDVVFDLVGGEGWPAVIGVVRRGGSYVVAGAVAGPHVPLDLRTVYLADLTIRGVAVTPPGLFADLVRHIERGAISPAVSAVFPFDRVADAQAAMLARRHVGKIVLAGWSETG